MVVIRTSRELALMREAGRISANALKLAGEAVEPGVSTLEIDTIVRKYIEKEGAIPSFLGYGGFPASACISVNDVVIHGIPSKKCILKEGDIVSVDVGAFIDGFHGDNAYTFPCGKISAEAQALLKATEESLYEGIKAAVAGNRHGFPVLCPDVAADRSGAFRGICGGLVPDVRSDRRGFIGKHESPEGAACYTQEVVKV